MVFMFFARNLKLNRIKRLAEEKNKTCVHDWQPPGEFFRRWPSGGWVASFGDASWYLSTCAERPRDSQKNERFQVNCIGNYQAKLLKCKEQGQNGGLAFGFDIDLCLQSISFAQDSVVEKTAMARNGETFSDGLRSSETKAAGDLMS